MEGIHRKNIQAGNCEKDYQLNRPKPQQIKYNFLKRSKNQQ